LIWPPEPTPLVRCPNTQPPNNHNNAGMEAIGRLAFRFLKRKVAEYEEIRNQIQTMNDMLQEMYTGGMDDPDLLQQVGRIIG
jgi:hypothetical protein